MAKKEGYVVDLNKLWRYDDTTGEFVAPKALWANGKEYYAAFSNGEMTFNKANYELYLEDTTLVALADGTIVDPYVYYSRKTDFDGTQTEVEITDTLGDIEPNYTDQEKRGEFRVTQKISNFELTGTYRQRKDSSNDEYYDLRITYIVCPLIPAGGGSRPLTIGYSVVHKRRYESGKLEEEIINSTTTSFVEADVDTTDKSSFNTSTGKLSGDSLLKDPTEESPIATVKYVKISLYGLTAEWRGSQAWNQEANTVEYNTTYEAWSYAEPDPLEDDTIGVEGAVILFHGRAYQRITGIWTSEEPADTTTVTEPLYFSTNYGTFPNGSTRYTMMDEGTIELQVGSTDTDRIINVNVNNAYAGYYEEYRYRQSAKEFVGYNHFIGFMEALVGYDQAPAGGGSVVPSVTVYVKMCAEYSDGSYDEDDWKKVKATNVRVTSASAATDEYDGMASLNKKNGVVTVNDLGTTEWKDVHTAFVVNSMSGLFDVGSGVYDRDWSWSGTAIVEQEENIKNYTGEVGYTYDAVIQPDTLEGNDTIISVDYDAWQHTYYYWNSRPSNMLSDDVAQWLYIRITGAATASKDVKGSGTYTYDVGTVGTTDRTFNVAVTNNSGNVVASSTITQLAPTSFHYELVQVDDAGVSYEEAFAWANSVSPYIQVRAWFKKVWSNGVADPNLVYEDHSVGESGFTISNAAGQPKNDSLATINSSTGVVSVKSLGTNRWEKPHDVFEVQSLYGTFKSALTNKSHGWQMTGTAVVEQAKNELNDKATENIYKITKPEDLLSGDSVLYIAYQSEDVITRQWDSDRYGDYLDVARVAVPMTIKVSGSYTGEVTVNKNSGTATFTVGVNNSTTSTRSFTVKAYVSGKEVGSFVVEQQKVQEVVYYWEAPTVNSLSFGEIPASGKAIPIYVNFTQRYMKRTGTIEEVVNNDPRSVIAATLSGSNANDSSPAIIDGGYVGTKSLGTTPTSSTTPIYNIVGGTFKGMDDVVREFTRTGSVVQARNYKNPSGSLVYNVSIRVDGVDEVLAATTYVNLIASATATQYYVYSALPDDLVSETSAVEGKLTASSGATVSPTSITGSNKTAKLSFAANTQSSQKEYTATITAGGKSASAKVTQAANILSWIAPIINGEFAVSNISAKGGNTTVRVPVKQYKVNTSGTPVEPIYTWWADALAIQGTPSNGGSTSGGVISAPNLGQTPTSERTIFTITGVKIQGWDGNEYTIKVSPSVAVKQNANTKSLERSRYTVSIAPQGNLSNAGGSVRLNVSAYEWVSEFWASAPDTPVNEQGYEMTGYVTAPSGGTITGSPIKGTGKQVTFTYNQENIQPYQIGLTANLRAVSSVGMNDITTSCQVLQNAVSFVLNAGEDKECNATASTVQVSFESNRNGKPWEPTFSTNLSGATIGSITQSGTMFYVNVNVPENKTSSNRDIVVTATQTRSGGTTATATVTITQAAAASAVVRTVNAYGSWNSGGTAVVNITAYLSNNSGSSVTFSGIKVELRRRLKTQGYNPESAELVTTASYSGSVSVGAGGSSNVSISNITHTRSSSYYYWLVAYATQTTETTYNEIEEYEPEG